MSHEADHAYKPYANAAGVFLGLLVWWAAAGLLAWLVLKLWAGGEPA